jgi:beta-N-acetylhexosaminidase
VIETIIRGRIGFDGLLMSDDLDMKALKGDVADLARGVVDAGCDIALNCWGRMDEMLRIAERLPEMSDLSRARLDRAIQSAVTPADMPDLKELLATRDELLALA